MAKHKRNTKSDKVSQGAQRRVVVFAALLAAMTATSALLLALAPAPLAPGAAGALFAVGTPESLDAVFNTAEPARPGRWRYVYVHHSRTAGGSAATFGESATGLADHFVIGNGDGCGDGEVQVAQRWQRQAPAGQMPNVASIDPACISVCVVGDLNRTAPTPTQVLRLTQLVITLQDRFHIPADAIYLRGGDATVAGVGKFFPIETVRPQFLP